MVVVFQQFYHDHVATHATVHITEFFLERVLTQGDEMGLTLLIFPGLLSHVFLQAAFHSAVPRLCSNFVHSGECHSGRKLMVFVAFIDKL